MSSLVKLWVDMILDPSLWVLMAFICLIFLVGNRSWLSLRQYLDQRAENIHNDIKAAHQLKEEAQFILNHALRLQKEMNDRFHEIITHSETEIERLKFQAQQDLDDYLFYEENLLTAKLLQLENQTIQHIEKKVVEVAFTAAQHVVADHVNEITHDILFKKGIAEISRIPRDSHYS